MSLDKAFNYLLQKAARPMTIERLNSRNGAIAAVDILAAFSNYSRNMAFTEEVVVRGRELVISWNETLKASDFADTGIRRGDRIKDTELGEFIVTEAEPMIAMGNIIGYRVRTG